MSLIDLVDDPAKIEVLLAFDDDDMDSYQWFEDHIADALDQAGIEFTAYKYPRYGYQQLHRYVNGLAAEAQGHWLLFWNDDAVMLDQGWDTVIRSHSDRFCVLAFDTHKKHPYSIFPILPKAWFDLLGHLSQHQLNDAWISQIAWMLDIMVRIDVRVEHDRFDLTGQNGDITYKQRKIFEGNPSDPRDFNHVDARIRRGQEADTIAKYLISQGYEMKFWQAVMAGQQDPWEKMLASDVNKQMSRF